MLGNVTAEYRWFPLAYIVFAFLLVPAFFVAISLASTALTVAVVALAVAAGLFVWGVTCLQRRHPGRLPAALRTWDACPLWCRSLEPYDRHCCGRAARWAAGACPCCRPAAAAGGAAVGLDTSTDSVELVEVSNGGPSADDLAKATSRIGAVAAMAESGGAAAVAVI